MRELIKRVGPLDLEARRRGRPADAYGALLRSIVGQQLSTKAARTIYERMTQLWDGGTPTPEQLLERLAQGARNAELASDFGLSTRQVQGIRMGSAREIARRRDRGKV